MEYIAPIVNTLLLLIIFFYQRNRNKTLEDRISEQTKLLCETKSVVGQQATAIQSQNSIVDSAIKYGEAFNINKLEDIIKREVTLDKNEEIRNIEEKYKELEGSVKSPESIKKSVENMAALVGGIFHVPLQHYMKYLVLLSEDERNVEISNIENKDSKDFIIELYESIVQEIIKKT